MDLEFLVLAKNRRSLCFRNVQREFHLDFPNLNTEPDDQGWIWVDISFAAVETTNQQETLQDFKKEYFLFCL